MLRTSFTLITKRQLTHDVFELIYSCENLSSEPPLAGQYVMFQLAPWLNRAYSLASFTLRWMNPSFTLIIKRIADGRGSPLICDAEIGTVFHGMIPLGHFTLHNTKRAKCFIGTGTGFAPLYCQLLECSSSMDEIFNTRVGFIFGVRNLADSFYENEFGRLGAQFKNFEYIQYFSRETRLEWRTLDQAFRRWYVTDWIISDNIEAYEEFYLCGSPAMVKDARAKLESLGVKNENIYWEQF